MAIPNAHRITLWCSAFVSLLAHLAPPALASSVSKWTFQVKLDDRDIGSHTFEVARSDDRASVKSVAAFDVTFLFFTAYSYRHECHETWEDNQLVRIESRTKDNRKTYRLDGEKTAQGFRIRTESGDELLDAPVMSFAYWNPDILERDQLLNSQTGDYETIEVVPSGTTTIDYQGGAIPAVRYDVQARDKTISLWYSQDGHQWIALETPVGNGRTLRYAPVQLPIDPEEKTATIAAPRVDVQPFPITPQTRDNFADSAIEAHSQALNVSDRK